jgi:hypothetical protein
MGSRERILEYLKNKKITKYQFYKETGLSNGFLDKDGAIGSDKCEQICYQYKDLSAEWLITGKGNMFKNQYAETTADALTVQEASVAYPHNDSTLLDRLEKQSEEIGRLRKIIEDLKLQK